MLDNCQVFYIYGLYSTSNNTIRYIGYTNNPNRRYSEHLKRSKYLNFRKDTWIQSELNKGFKIKIKVLSCTSLLNVYNAEEETIYNYRHQGIDLVNGNNGGRGCVNPTKEVKEKISKTLTGYKHSIEARNNIGKGHKGLKYNRIMVMSQETKNKISKSNLGRVFKHRLFNEEQVINIFKYYNKGYTSKEIGNIFKINHRTIEKLLNTSIYSDIKNKYNLMKISRKGNNLIFYNRLKLKNNE